MKTSSKNLDDFKTEITVTIPAEDVDKRFEENMAEAIKDINVPGFRKGKAPKDLLKKQINEEKLWEITRRELIDDTLGDALKEEKVEALSSEDLKEDAHTPGEDFTYHCIIRLMPEIPDFEYKDIPVQLVKREIGGKEIDDAFENLRISWAESTPITDRPAQEGDWALIQLEGYELNRIKLPGQSDEPKRVFPPTQLSLNLGGERGIEWLDGAVTGMSVGEEKTAHLMMPKDFINPPLEEDTEVDTKLKLLWIESKIMPEITDDYIAEKQIAKDVEEFRGKIKEELEKQSKRHEDDEAATKIQDWLIENVKFDLPDDIVEEKKEEITERMREEFHRRGDDLDNIMKRIDDDAIKIREEIGKQALLLAKLDFIIPKVAERENMEVTQPEILNHIQMVAQMSQLKKHQVKQLMEDTHFLMHTYKSILNRKVTNFMLNHAKREYIAPDTDESSESKLIVE